MRNSRTNFARFMRTASVASLGAVIAFCTVSAPQAQRVKEPEVRVTGVAARTSDKEATVSISADGSLTRAQTWQDKDGFHVVLPKGQTALPNSAPRGVKIQRVGDSLEFVVPVKPGASVTVQPRQNRLDLVVSGGMQETANDAERARESQSAKAGTRGAAREGARGNAGERASASNLRAQAAPTAGVLTEKGTAARAKASNDKTGPQTPAPEAAESNNAAPALSGSVDVSSASANEAQQSAAQAQALSNAAQAQKNGKAGEVQQEQSQSSSVIFSSKGLIGGGVMAAGLLGCFIFVYRRRRLTVADDDVHESHAPGSVQKRDEVKAKGRDAKGSADAREQVFEQAKGDRRKVGDRRMIARGGDDRRKSGVGAEPSATRTPNEETSLEKSNGNGAHGKPVVTRMPSSASMPAVLFGAFRINEEVSKLLQGEAHSIEVLASRATDDRRAIETSLIKALHSRDLEPASHRRAQGALEEYGFVARQSAMLLLASEAYERASAARMLGEVRSPSSLPFLLEALYDPEAVVRNEVVMSLGALRLPRAIGALIDMARRYPEMPVAVLRPALNACSVDTAEPEWVETARTRTPLVYVDGGEPFTGEIVGLEVPEAVEQLPEWLENETLADALERLSSADVEARTLAAQSLAQFQVQRSVEALAAMSSGDVEVMVRAAAVTSLGVVDHESVFAPVLMALADEAREVRAAAARALSRLSFNRADAYVRVIETATTEVLRGVAQACVKAGLAAQALDRLTSADRRQAYEAFSLLSLVVKAGELSLVLEAVAQHGSIDVRLAALRLLCMMGQPIELVEPLRRLAEGGGTPEKVRTALNEALTRLESSEVAPAGEAAARKQW